MRSLTATHPQARPLTRLCGVAVLGAWPSCLPVTFGRRNAAHSEQRSRFWLAFLEKTVRVYYRQCQKSTGPLFWPMRPTSKRWGGRLRGPDLLLFVPQQSVGRENAVPVLPLDPLQRTTEVAASHINSASMLISQPGGTRAGTSA